MGRVCHQRSTSSSARRISDWFRKIIMKFILSLPSRTNNASTTQATTSVLRRQSCDGRMSASEPPKTSSLGSSSYYSSESHYSEAIADCIEFFNRSSSHNGFLNSQKSDVVI
ncbi:hypothetical protein Nepgr_005098 [Nepenthes gracilis]|uniref:Josephin-like protein n=1 Tax=Nepenthes gracilis TaxID=150966 RepID=A0AAD3S2J1_NEPGR|nr:hypothetical protein Nepgr_005098 [Nepenthes gracilis]